MNVIKHFVVGLLLLSDSSEILLVQKARPQWQAGLLNGPGGRKQDNETVHQAMAREFREETGIWKTDWQGVLSLTLEDEVVWFFVGYTADQHLSTLAALETDEPAAWYPLSNLAALPMVDDLKWIVPLAQHQPRADMKLQLFR